MAVWAEVLNKGDSIEDDCGGVDTGYSVDQLVRCMIVLEREVDEIVVDTPISIREI